MNYESVYTSVLCIFVVGFVVLFPAFLSEFMWRNYQKAQESDEFINKFDSLIKEFDIQKGILQINFYPVFLIRRCLFGAILVFLFDYPTLQLICIEFTTICVNIYIYIYRC